MLPSRTITMAIPQVSVQTVDQKLAALDARLTALENLLNLKKDGSATLKATSLAIEAISVEVRTMQSISMRAGTELVMRASSAAMLKGDAQVNVETGGTATVKGSVLKLNDAGKSVARVGDQVTPAGVIVSGNPTIMA